MTRFLFYVLKNADLVWFWVPFYLFFLILLLNKIKASVILLVSLNVVVDSEFCKLSVEVWSPSNKVGRAKDLVFAIVSFMMISLLLRIFHRLPQAYAVDSIFDLRVDRFVSVFMGDYSSSDRKAVENSLLSDSFNIVVS